MKPSLTLASLALTAGCLLTLGATLTTVSANHVEGHEQGRIPVTICHATDSHSNPYTNLTVDQDSVDGDQDNDNGQGDHFLLHNGPVWFDGIADHSWGDIIPPIFDEEGNQIHGGLNWTEEGQAFYNNNCNAPSDEPEASPSPTPASSPNPSENPGNGGGNGGSDNYTRLGYNVTCESNDIEFTFDVVQGNDKVKDARVVFQYGPHSREVRTNENGRAAVFLAKADNETTVYADAENYADQSTVVHLPSECATKPAQQGQVLGASTLADTSAVSLTALSQVIVTLFLLNKTVRSRKA